VGAGRWQGGQIQLLTAFFGAIADQVGPPLPVNDFWHAFFAIDQQLEALCRLLMEKPKASARTDGFTSNR